MNLVKLIEQVLTENEVQVFDNYDEQRYANNRYYQFVSIRGKQIASAIVEREKRREIGNVKSDDSGLFPRGDLAQIAERLNTPAIFKVVDAQKWNNTIANGGTEGGVNDRLKKGMGSGKNGIVKLDEQVPEGCDFVERDIDEMQRARTFN